MQQDERFEPYYFHEQGFDSLEEIEDWFEWEIPAQFNIADAVCDQWAARTPDRVALYIHNPDGTPETYTFAELENYANQLANALSDNGVEPGDRIAINGTQRLESLVGNIAAFKLGAVAIPLTVLLGTDGLAYRLTDSQPSVFLADEAAIGAVRSVADQVDALSTIVTYGDYNRGEEVNFWEAISGKPTDFDTVSTDATDPAFIVYTSGTTGEPKGVVHAHQHLLGGVTQFVSLQCHDTSADQVVRTVAEWSWIMSLPGMVLPALFYGMPAVGYSSRGFEPETEFAVIDRFDITHLNLPPTAVRMMMQIDDPAETYDLSSLQSFSTGGESADAGIIEWVVDTFPNASFLEGYGASEFGGLISDDPAMGYEHRIGYFGIPSVGHEIAVLDRDTGEPIDTPGTIGELAVRAEGNPVVFEEYLNKPERTDAAFTDGWFLTDDLVSRDEDGYVQFHSRSDDLIISSGYRIAPKEIESALLGHPSVQHVGVIGVPDETRGEIPMAYVEVIDSVTGNDELKTELQDYVKEHLAKHKYPRRVAFTDDLPTTTTGKVRRESLRERAGVSE